MVHKIILITIGTITFKADNVGLQERREEFLKQ
jgi:hypothetical protein